MSAELFRRHQRRARGQGSGQLRHKWRNPNTFPVLIFKISEGRGSWPQRPGAFLKKLSKERMIKKEPQFLAGPLPSKPKRGKRRFPLNPNLCL